MSWFLSDSHGTSHNPETELRKGGGDSLRGIAQGHVQCQGLVDEQDIRVFVSHDLLGAY